MIKIKTSIAAILLAVTPFAAMADDPMRIDSHTTSTGAPSEISVEPLEDINGTYLFVPSRSHSTVSILTEEQVGLGDVPHAVELSDDSPNGMQKFFVGPPPKIGDVVEWVVTEIKSDRTIVIMFRAKNHEGHE